MTTETAAVDWTQVFEMTTAIAELESKIYVVDHHVDALRGRRAFCQSEASYFKEEEKRFDDNLLKKRQDYVIGMMEDRQEDAFLWTSGGLTSKEFSMPLGSPTTTSGPGMSSNHLFAPTTPTSMGPPSSSFFPTTPTPGQSSPMFPPSPAFPIGTSGMITPFMPIPASEMSTGFMETHIPVLSQGAQPQASTQSSIAFSPDAQELDRYTASVMKEWKVLYENETRALRNEQLAILTERERARLARTKAIRERYITCCQQEPESSDSINAVWLVNMETTAERLSDPIGTIGNQFSVVQLRKDRTANVQARQYDDFSWISKLSTLQFSQVKQTASLKMMRLQSQIREIDTELQSVMATFEKKKEPIVYIRNEISSALQNPKSRIARDEQRGLPVGYNLTQEVMTALQSEGTVHGQVFPVEREIWKLRRERSRMDYMQKYWQKYLEWTIQPQLQKKDR